MVSHMDACCENLAKNHKLVEPSRRASLRSSLICFARFYNLQGRYVDAEKLLNDILKRDELQPPEDISPILQARIYKAEVHHNQGRYREAAQELLEILKEENTHPFGPGSSLRLTAVTSLARVYYREASYDEAVTLYNRALSEHLQCPHEHAAEILNIYENLAMVLRNQGDHNAAVELYNKALTGFEKLYGPDNVRSLKTMVQLANVYRNQTLYDKTLPLYQRALAGNEKRFGPEHLNTLENMANLAINLRNLGQYSEAEILFSKAKVGMQKVLGDTHPDTLRTMMNLAINYHKQGNYSEAQSLYVVVLEGREKVLGLNHHYTWRTVECLADLFWIQGCREEAEQLAERCMPRASRSNTDKKRRPIERSPERNHSLPDISSVDLNAARQYIGLEALFLRALKRDQTSLKGYHADKLDTMMSLGRVYVEQERYEEARDIFTEVLAVSKERYGTDHRECARVAVSLGEVNEIMGLGTGYDSGIELEEG